MFALPASIARGQVHCGIGGAALGVFLAAMGFGWLGEWPRGPGMPSIEHGTHQLPMVFGEHNIYI